MTYKLTVIFDGLVAVGPPYPRGPNPHGPAPSSLQVDGPLFAVMPRSTRQKDRSSPYTDGEARYIPFHLPAIFARLDGASKTTRQKNTSSLPLSSNGRRYDEMYGDFGIWYPVRERMKLRVDGGYSPGVLTYEHDPNFEDPGQPGDPTKTPSVKCPYPICDIAAVPDMRRIWPRRRRLRRSILSGRTPAPPELAAQVFIPSGIVRSGAEDARRCGTNVTFKPDRTCTGHELKMIALPQVRVEVDIPKSFTIAMSSLDTGKKLDPLSFELCGDSEIWIANMDPLNIRYVIGRLSNPPLSPLDVQEPPDCDPDFALYYTLLAGGRGGKGLSIPCDYKPGGMRKCYGVMVEGPKD